MLRSTGRRFRRSGFTLIELMLVIIIIGVLAAMVVPSFARRAEQAKVNAARADIRGGLSTALDLFEQDTGAYPTTDQGLRALVEEPSEVSGWTGPYLKDVVVPPDPWGREYVYTSPGEKLPYELVSYGKDGKEGGGDDIANYTEESD